MDTMVDTIAESAASENERNCTYLNMEDWYFIGYPTQPLRVPNYSISILGVTIILYTTFLINKIKCI